ncbi:MAG TPA: cation:proton antiporter [Candidatus Merdenecus merdavium]|nr:cation:proton antiporter [Candidatus Merdenecus merdavium]
MLESLAVIFLMGMFLGWILKKVRIPSLLGMLITGMILGPYALNLIHPSILNISTDLRQIALIIILTRAGLSLDINELKKVGRPAIFMCFVPACFEILGMVILAPRILGISTIEAAIMGAVVGAVSPAVIVPKMLTFMEEGYGVKKSIPQLILAGASVDDVFVIVMFTAFVGMEQGKGISAVSFIQIPISILSGIAFGLIIGVVFQKVFQRIHIRDSAKVLILLCISFFMVTLETKLKGVFPFSGLLAVMSIGIAVRKKNANLSQRLATKYSKLWVGAEVLLFVLVGATVNLSYAFQAGGAVVLLILLVLLFRVTGVLVCLVKTDLNWKERIFCMIAYMPKATVQAAIGGIPLALGLDCGQIVLTVAVLAILITAPLGAFGIDFSYKKTLSKDHS